MCPDASLLSAYVDGEVPSPWKERIEEHLASCPACSARVSGYRGLAGALAEGEQGGLDEAAAVARLRARLGAALDQPLLPSRPSRKVEGLKGFSPKPILWRRSVSLPLPVAAAAAVVIVFLAGIAASSLFRPARSPVQTLAAAEIKPTKTQPENMEALISYLQSQDAQVSLTIQLPSGATFDGSGKPLVVKAEPSEYVPFAGYDGSSAGSQGGGK
jgi:anti-sigma factor RsiW